MNMKMVRRLPHMLAFAWDKWTYARQAEAIYNQIKADAAKYPIAPSPDLSEAQLLAVIDELILLNRRSTYETTVTILLMQFYNRLLKSRLERLGIDFQRFALTDDMPALAQHDPHASLQALNNQFCQLTRSSRRTSAAAITPHSRYYPASILPDGCRPIPGAIRSPERYRHRFQLCPLARDARPHLEDHHRLPSRQRR